MLNPTELFNQLTAAGRKAGFETIQYGEVENDPLFALQQHSKQATHNIYISSGIHGDEPAPILAILKLLQNNSFPSDTNITICPLANPNGLSLGTRENANGIDLNRDFKFPKSTEATALSKLIDTLPPTDLSICLHEDWESSGFYLYYLNPNSHPLAKRVISQVSLNNPIEPSNEIDGRPASSGIISPPNPLDFDMLEGEWPEAFYLYSKNNHTHFTLETPSSFPMPERIKMHVIAIEELFHSHICD